MVMAVHLSRNQPAMPTTGIQQRSRVKLLSGRFGANTLELETDYHIMFLYFTIE